MPTPPNILDDFSEATPKTRFHYYTAYTFLVVGLVWGMAYLHSEHYIDIMPVPYSIFPYLGILALVLAQLYIYKKIRTGKIWFFLIMIVFVFVPTAAVLAYVIDLAGLEAQNLPFWLEMRRLSIFSVGHCLSTLGAMEFLYRIAEEKLV